MKTAVVLLLFALAGCMTTPSQETNTLKGVEYACASSTAALKTIIIFNDKLTPEQRRVVTQATLAVNPVCSQPTPPTLSTVSQAVLAGALSQLTSVANAVSK